MKKLSENADKFSPRILDLQQILNKVNPHVKVDETGIWGNTDNGVRDFLSSNKQRIQRAFPDVKDEDFARLSWQDISKKVMNDQNQDYTPTVTGLTNFIKDIFFAFATKTASSSDETINKMTKNNREGIARTTKDWKQTRMSKHFGLANPSQDLEAFWSPSTFTLVAKNDMVYVNDTKGNWSGTGASPGLYRYIYGVTQGMIRESKSFGTLLRERYWGRY